MDITDEGIAQFAQHLVPEAFTTASTASRVEILSVADHGWLGDWVASCLRDGVGARDLNGEPIPGVIFVQRGDERWRWDLPHAIWPMQVLVNRVRRELSDFPEPCVFVADFRDRQLQQLHALMRKLDDEPAWSAPWYAEERSRRRADVMCGIANVSTGARPSPAAPRRSKSFERSARSLLTGHPSRRRFRLR